MRGIGIGGLVRRIIDHIASCGSRPLVVAFDVLALKKGDVDRAVRHRIGSVVEGDGGDVAREELVIDNDSRGKSDDLLRNDSAADDRLDGAGGLSVPGVIRVTFALRPLPCAVAPDQT